MPTQFVDIEQVVKNWAWREFDRTSTKKQRKLREKERSNNQTYIGISLDWSEVKFRDETVWSRISDDSGNVDDVQKKPQEGAPAAVVGAKEGGAAGSPTVSVLFHTKFSNNTKDTQEYTMRTEKTTRSTCTTEVENGYTRGVDLAVNLKTPCEILEVNAGYHSEVSLTNSAGQEFEEELTWGVESMIKVKPDHVAEAQLVVNERKQGGSFTIETKIKGMVYVTFNNIRDNNSLLKATGHDFAEIMEEYLKQERKKGEAMDFVQIKDDAVFITTRGICRFRYGIQQEVQVNQTPLNGMK